MIGFGTLINVIAIMIGGGIGLVGSKWLTPRCQEALMRSMGVCVLFFSISGALEHMLVMEGTTLSSQGTMMLVISISLGCLIGELLKLDIWIERFGQWLRRISGNGLKLLFIISYLIFQLISAAKSCSSFC